MSEVRKGTPREIKRQITYTMTMMDRTTEEYEQKMADYQEKVTRLRDELAEAYEMENVN